PRALCARILPRRSPLMRPCRSGGSSRWPWLVVPVLLLWLRTFLLLSPAVVLLWGAVSAALASGLPPTVNPGPVQVLDFPARELTLSGYAMDPEKDPLTVQWTVVSGPAAVRFSASKALATTVTFTTTGTYVFQLAASDGTSTVTSTVQVTINPASSQTAFY